jgi:hypothetical protein
MAKKNQPPFELSEYFHTGHRFRLTDEGRRKIDLALHSFLDLKPHEQAVFIQTLRDRPGNPVHETGKLLSKLLEQIHALKTQLAKHRKPRKQSERNRRILELRRQGLTQGQIADKEVMTRKAVEKVCRDERKRMDAIDWARVKETLQRFLDTVAPHLEGWRRKQR